MNVLQLVQAATGEMGLTQPTYVAGNPDIAVTQYLALLNAAGAELSRKHLWEQLVRENVFTTQVVSTTGNVTPATAVITGIPSTTGLDTTYMVSGNGVAQAAMIKSVDSATQVTLTLVSTGTFPATALTFGKTQYSLPSDYDRQIDRTHYDKSKRWEMIGPETAQQWQFLKSSWISTGPRVRYRIYGGYFQVWPIVSTADVLSFEYISKSWALSSTALAQTQFLNDTDTCIYPDRLMVLDLKRKFYEAKGFDTSAYERDYEFELNLAKTSDAGSPTLSMAPRLNSTLIGWYNIPDSGMGS
jgi:hypothetical protein